MEEKGPIYTGASALSSLSCHISFIRKSDSSSMYIDTGLCIAYRLLWLLYCSLDTVQPTKEIACSSCQNNAVRNDNNKLPFLRSY